MTFRQLARQLHPDARGDNSKVVEFTELMRRRRNECLCGCGRQRPHNNRQFYDSICRLRYRYPQLKALAAVLLAVACLGAGLPPMPPVKKKVQALHSPRGKELYSSVSMAVAIVAPTKKWFLHWSYPISLPQPGIEFDIEKNVGNGWEKIGSTNAPPWPITTSEPKAFYRVGAHRSE